MVGKTSRIMEKKLKTTLIILSLNEIEGMKQIMPRIRKEWCNQIIILDGGSTDGTIEYARSQGCFVHVQKSIGIRRGYREILPLIEGNVVITFSPDGNSIPELIPDLIKKIQEGYDMVIVSRYLPGVKSYDDDILTAFGNWLLTKTVNLLYGANYTDVLVLFRAYKTQIIHDLELASDEGYKTAEKMFRSNISWEPLVSVRAAKRKLKIAEIPGDEPRRLGGTRKLKIFRHGAICYFQFIRELFCWR